MLILNFYIFENEYELNPNFKTSYVDIKLYSVLLQVLKYCYFKTSYVDIKPVIKATVENSAINFKTSYVDIKLFSIHFQFTYFLNFKTSYVDIKPYDH